MDEPGEALVDVVDAAQRVPVGGLHRGEGPPLVDHERLRRRGALARAQDAEVSGRARIAVVAGRPARTRVATGPRGASRPCLAALRPCAARACIATRARATRARATRAARAALCSCAARTCIATRARASAHGARPARAARRA